MRLYPHDLQVGDRVVVNEPILSTEPIHGTVVDAPRINRYQWTLIVRPDDLRVMIRPSASGIRVLLSDTQREEAS